VASPTRRQGTESAAASKFSEIEAARKSSHRKSNGTINAARRRENRGERSQKPDELFWCTISAHILPNRNHESRWIEVVKIVLLESPTPPVIGGSNKQSSPLQPAVVGGTAVV